ncbi:ATP phosphoribosyltransferase regulatory subunit [Desulfonema magnum]|uniref:Histidyl-tRNA synthetase n=1 Tax=Desulfonema magnum TaxID=45655 RepID=A0A975BUE4_9BACT|nr:ATP phosphoribosyltransferase regulatory subunit [Desulfonema magnum]QTA91330.1 Histidyl-tRNA synthetase [Desulfonema magnum]
MKHKSSKNDLTIDEILRVRKLERAFLSRCRHFGYDEIRTAAIEPLYIFTALGALSDTKLRRMYSFIDWDGWSGERVALKPDSTTCVARFYGDHLYTENARQKLCYVENHFEWADSWDELSERWQFGVENIGSTKSESDIEIIYMAYDVFQEIGFKDTYLYISYPALIKELIAALSLWRTDRDDLIAAIRKNDADQVGEILDKVQDGEKLQTLLSLKGKSSNYLKNMRSTLEGPKYENVRPALENFISVCELLDRLECPYEIDFSLLGDLEYYTGIQFQILSTPARKSKKDILCAGGRYDNLIGSMLKLVTEDLQELSEPVPAVGFALYVRNIIRHRTLIEHTTALTDKRQNICIYISNVTKYNVNTGQILSDKLSRMGFVAKITFSPVEQEKYEGFGLVIEVDNERFNHGYQILFSQKIGKPLLMNLFGEFNER